MRVEGVIECVGSITPVAGATLRVLVQDVSRADADAVTLAEHVRHDVSIPPGDDELNFSLDVTVPDPRARCAVFAHVDVDGSGELEVGDLISTEHIAVDPTRSLQRVNVRVQQIS